VLVIISAIYLLRAFALVPALALAGRRAPAFDVWSSLIVLIYGVAYAAGTRQAWPYLTPKRTS